ncbi:zinc finger protein CONSTANS-LIKE 9-like [Macadamia integrifolia]|uniref:zinc finger protein CONSTANS-LIKE 9-like n=1 Tax=Macadamia integrifolia TaxID=60698 RepID=UPI001C4E816A|nr:zinc finger protein CONSTANS-LIKE 9-like [Macadamia integrifolia]
MFPWFPPCPDNSYPSASRDSAVMRYKAKRNNRRFEKKIRYASRKASADVRKCVKGRFVKAGDAYDYDPLCQTRSY